jgi:hypothetical protein
MTNQEDKAYEMGSQAAWRQMLSTALANLPGAMSAPERMLAARTAELHDVRMQLRALCAEFGDNDWPDELHLGDVIDKHLARHLYERRGEKEVG